MHWTVSPKEQGPCGCKSPQTILAHLTLPEGSQGTSCNDETPSDGHPCSLQRIAFASRTSESSQSPPSHNLTSGVHVLDANLLYTCSSALSNLCLSGYHWNTQCTYHIISCLHKGVDRFPVLFHHRFSRGCAVLSELEMCKWTHSCREGWSKRPHIIYNHQLTFFVSILAHEHPHPRDITQ